MLTWHQEFAFRQSELTDVETQRNLPHDADAPSSALTSRALQRRGAFKTDSHLRPLDV